MPLEVQGALPPSRTDRHDFRHADCGVRRHPSDALRPGLWPDWNTQPTPAAVRRPIRLKVSLLILVVVHALVFRGSVYNRAAEFDRDGVPGRAKLAAALSLLLWISIACMGRGIGYIEPPFGIHAQLFDLLHP